MLCCPRAPSLEKEGTFTSTERRIQRLYQVFEPLEGSRPDWQIVQDIANRLGASWHYQHPSEIMDEIASLTPMFAGVNYERLEGYKSLQWPVAADGTDQPLLYTKAFRFSRWQGAAVPCFTDSCRPTSPMQNSTCISTTAVCSSTFTKATSPIAPKEFARRLPTRLSKSPPNLPRSAGFRAAAGCS